MRDDAEKKLLYISRCKDDLDNKLKSLHYLENVEKETENFTEIESCIICLENVTKVCGNTNLCIHLRLLCFIIYFTVGNITMRS